MPSDAFASASDQGIGRSKKCIEMKGGCVEKASMREDDEEALSESGDE